MYLQSAEILNFHGIRHLKINFEPETSALIGENAWGKSSLLSALWLILGQGNEHLCTFSKNDLYIPIRLGGDATSDGASESATEGSSEAAAESAGIGAVASHAKDGADGQTESQSNRGAGTAQTVTVPAGADKGTGVFVSSSLASSSLNAGAGTLRTKAAAGKSAANHLESQAKGILSERFKHLTPEYLAELKPYKVITTRDYQRFYFAVPNAEHTGNILRIIDLPLEPKSQAQAGGKDHKQSNAKKSKQVAAQATPHAASYVAPQVATQAASGSLSVIASDLGRPQDLKISNLAALYGGASQSEDSPAKQEHSRHKLKAHHSKDKKSGDSQLYSFYNAALARFLANNTPTVALSGTALPGSALSETALSGSDKYRLNPVAKATADLQLNCQDSVLRMGYPGLSSGKKAGQTNRAALSPDAQTLSGYQTKTSGLKGEASLQDLQSANNSQNGKSKEELFQAMREAQTQEADFERQHETPLSATHLMMRARNLLDEPDGLDASARKYVQDDYDFFANDIYQASADKIVIDLIFCENTYGTINNIERFAKIRKACFYGEDGLYRVHYRITGEFASQYAQHNSPDAISLGVKSGTVVYATSGSATSTQAYQKEDAPNDHRGMNSDVLANREDNFVTVHELLDEKGQPIANALPIILDIITLNPLLRLRDRRMLKLSEMEDVVQTVEISDSATASNRASGFDSNAGVFEHSSAALGAGAATLEEYDKNEDICKLRALFVSINQEDDLTCDQLNQGLDELNVIASKYLVNYRSNYYIQNHPHNGKSRTARDIVSHPVSIETLNTLKQSLEDKRPSRSKLLLSLLAGAMLMNNGTREIDTFSKPILVLEDIEGRFHPTLLLSLWSILDTIPIQKIVTTNSSALLSAMPMSNIRRLCRQYYDVRCYSVPSQAFNVDDERRLAFHIRISRPSAFFARCWILVEGETEVWMLNEIAGILGMNLSCEGVKTIEFAQCGLAPLIKLAKQLGISYYVLTDGDDAGRKYAQTVQSFTGTQHISDHLSVIPHVDIEHYFYVSGYADVYQKAAGLNISPKKPKLERQKLSQLIEQAQDQVQAQGKAEDAASVSGVGGGIEIDPSPVQITLPQLLKFLQRWYNRHLALMDRLHSIELRPDERDNLQQAVVLGLDFLTPSNNQDELGQQIQELTFDISKVSIKDINQYYAQAELNLRKSGGLNRKLTNKQRQAIQRLRTEKAEVLYGLKLTNQKPHTKTLFKSKGSGGKKYRQYRENFRENFTLPSSLYTYLKRNFALQQQNKIDKLQNQLNIGHKFKHSPELPSTIHDKEWGYLKTLISNLQSLQHRQELKQQNPLTRNISHGLAQRLHLIKIDELKSVAESKAAATVAGKVESSRVDENELARTAESASADKLRSVEAEALFEGGTDSEVRAATEAKAEVGDKADAANLSKGQSLGNSTLSTRQWASKLAQEEQNPKDMFKSDLELASAHLDPLDEAKVLRKARQQVGIKYGSYGAIEQSVLNKQGWSIDKVIDSAIHKKSKPGLAIMVVEAMQQRGAESVPQMFRTMFMKIKRIAKSEFGI